MSCREAETKTLLWVYGEGPENHDHHVAGCPDCQQVVAEHESVAGDIAPILPVIRRPDDEEVPEPANHNGGWVRWAAVGAIAAAVVFFFQMNAPVTPEIAAEQPEVAEAIVAGVILPPIYADIDQDIDELDLLVDSLAADASIL